MLNLKSRSEHAHNTDQHVKRLLLTRLADALALSGQAKQVKWLAKSDRRRVQQDMFQEVLEHAENNADILADRLIALGGKALGTAQFVSERSSLVESVISVKGDERGVSSLSEALARFSRSLRRAEEMSAHYNDGETARIFSKMASHVDEKLWQIAALPN